MNDTRAQRMRHVATGIALAGLLVGIGAAAAQSGRVTIYRCTDAKGALTVQNDVPCPAGGCQPPIESSRSSRQGRRRPE